MNADTAAAVAADPTTCGTAPGTAVSCVFTLSLPHFSVL
jgi:hypothetical protein